MCQYWDNRLITNPGNERVVMTSIFGKRELVNCIREAIKRGITEQFVFTWHRSSLSAAHALLMLPASSYFPIKNGYLDVLSSYIFTSPWLFLRFQRFQPFIYQHRNSGQLNGTIHLLQEMLITSWNSSHFSFNRGCHTTHPYPMQYAALCSLITMEMNAYFIPHDQYSFHFKYA